MTLNSLLNKRIEIGVSFLLLLLLQLQIFIFLSYYILKAYISSMSLGLHSHTLFTFKISDCVLKHTWENFHGLKSIANLELERLKKTHRFALWSLRNLWKNSRNTLKIGLWIVCFCSNAWKQYDCEIQLIWRMIAIRLHRSLKQEASKSEDLEVNISDKKAVLLSLTVALNGRHFNLKFLLRCFRRKVAKICVVLDLNAGSLRLELMQKNSHPERVKLA